MEIYAQLTEAVLATIKEMESFAAALDDGIPGVVDCGRNLVNRQLTERLTGSDGYTADLVKVEVVTYRRSRTVVAYQLWATIKTHFRPRPSFGADLGPNVSAMLQGIAVIN